MSKSRDRYALNCKCGARGVVEVSEDHSMYGRGPIDPWVSHLEGPFDKAEAGHVGRVPLQVVRRDREVAGRGPVAQAVGFKGEGPPVRLLAHVAGALDLGLHSSRRRGHRRGRGTPRVEAGYDDSRPGLQFGGLAVAFVGLAGDAKAFGKSQVDPFVTWRDLRPGRRCLVTAKGTVNIGSGSAAFAVSRTKSPATDVDGRIAWLEERLYALQAQADTTAHSVHGLTEPTTRKLDGERKEREAADADLKGQLAQHAAGGVHLNVVALWWVFVGTMLGHWVSLTT